jgi:hypothetical protein
VDFWGSGVKELFGANGGYVLLSTDDAEHIGTVAGAGLTPIIRYDYRNYQAVPLSDPEIENWKQEFTGWIDAAHRDHPGVKVWLFIVGNEPGNEGTISSQNYAKAYTALWKNVHEGNGAQRLDTYLLVAGQAPHHADTPTWLRDVARAVEGEGAHVDGYTIHANGFGLEFDTTLKNDPDNGNRKDWPDVPYIAELLRGKYNMAACPQPSNPSSACDAVDWPGDDGFMTYKQQLDNIPPDLLSCGQPVFITEFNPGSWGTGDGSGKPLSEDQYYHKPYCPYTPANNYPLGWIQNAVGQVKSDSRVNGMLWYVGAPHPQGAYDDWKYFSLTNIYKYLPCAKQDFMNVHCEVTAGRPDLRR